MDQTTAVFLFARLPLIILGVLTDWHINYAARYWMGKARAGETYATNPDKMGFEMNNFNQLKESSISWYEEQGFDCLIFAKARYGNVLIDPELNVDQIENHEAYGDKLELLSTLKNSYIHRPNHDLLNFRLVL